MSQPEVEIQHVMVVRETAKGRLCRFDDGSESWWPLGWTTYRKHSGELIVPGWLWEERCDAGEINPDAWVWREL